LVSSGFLVIHRGYFGYCAFKKTQASLARLKKPADSTSSEPIPSVRYLLFSFLLLPTLNADDNLHSFSSQTTRSSAHPNPIDLINATRTARVLEEFPKLERQVKQRSKSAFIPST